MDLYAFPQGLYSRQPDGTYSASGLLKRRDSSGVYRVFCSWFDADNDGRRDLLLTYIPDTKLAQRVWEKIRQYSLFVNWKTKAATASQWVSTLYSNGAPEQKWLIVRPEGLVGSREAIGARVAVSSAGDRVDVQQVGQANNATRSQGHYQLYFGLGVEDVAENVTVTWSTGANTELGAVAANQILVIRQPEQVE
ncbi:MAG: ASPIC/UnbV domain-containing protein [Pseudomonadota bacterium]